MTIRYNESIATEIILSFDARPEMLVQILHAFVARYTYISKEAVIQIASISRRCPRRRQLLSRFSNGTTRQASRQNLPGRVLPGHG